MAQEREPVSANETVTKVLRKAQRRRGVPVRRAFVQRGRAGEGPLAGFIRRHDARALDLYLLAVAVASHEPWMVTLHSAVLSRALGWGDGKAGQVAVSRAFARLERRGLIRRARRTRHTAITILCEDGTGTEYTRPTGSTSADYYLQIPLQYWTADWYRRLTLVGKLALLIGLARNGPFSLPAERAPEWYGVSADTVERGLIELRRNGLLGRRRIWTKEPLSPKGWVWEYQYRLKEPFQPTTRRQTADEEVVLRVVSNESA